MTQIDFDDLPSAREVSDVSAGALPASYQGGSISIVSGFEADVTPRPQGNGSVTITDWVQIGRFAAGLDTAAAGVEFQRADCAPRSRYQWVILMVGIILDSHLKTAVTARPRLEMLCGVSLVITCIFRLQGGLFFVAPRRRAGSHGLNEKGVSPE